MRPPRWMDPVRFPPNLLLAGLVLATAAAGGSPPDSTATGRAPAFVRAPNVKLAYPGGRAPAVSLRYAAPPPRRFDLWTPRPQTFARNRFQTAVAGADRGAYLGLATGYVGSVLLGLWDEDTAMHVMAAGAALGALWGGTAGSDHLSVGVRYRDDE